MMRGVIVHMYRDKFGYNEKYLMKNGKPWFPIMGEIHYSRYPEVYWEESLYKMKSGGIDIVSSYVIWIHHEECEGDYDFSANKNLRKFVETCKSCGLYMALRIGPWCHGEVRNGGFPDWLLHKGYNLRTNDPDYLAEVRKFYTKIYEQVEGLLYEDGGPIICIQVENEYGHCGGLRGEEGERHMHFLKAMLREIGFEVPLYTATGWGGAVTGGMIPVMGGYCEAPWNQSVKEIAPNGNYIFTQERNDHNIGSDHHLGEGLTFDTRKFPFLTAELGGGLQVTHHRRPVAHSRDIGAMSMVKLGSGVNLLGYYMYHGGTNPKGKLTALQETRASGGYNDLPELSYDFRAPIREYGQTSETFKEIKLLAMFIKDFGEELCEMQAIIPEDNPLFQTNLEDIRYAYRHNGKSGYLFINNYQRRHKMAEHKEVILQIPLEEEQITYRNINLKDGDFFFYPFNLSLGKAILKTALATPLCKIQNEEGQSYIFYTDQDPEYQIEGCLSDVKLITLTREEAKNAYKVCTDRERLLISSNPVLITDEGVQINASGEVLLKVYPDFRETPKDFIRVGIEGEFTIYKKQAENCKAAVTIQSVKGQQEENTYELEIEVPTHLQDCFLQIEYDGDGAELYLEDEKIADHFYTGECWEVGLKRFNFPNKLTLKIKALTANAPIFLEKWPEFIEERACKLQNICLRLECKILLK